MDFRRFGALGAPLSRGSRGSSFDGMMSGPIKMGPESQTKLAQSALFRLRLWYCQCADKFLHGLRVCVNWHVSSAYMSSFPTVPFGMFVVHYRAFSSAWMSSTSTFVIIMSRSGDSWHACLIPEFCFFSLEQCPPISLPFPGFCNSGRPETPLVFSFVCFWLLCFGVTLYGVAGKVRRLQ